jgi:hypothetical protein
MLQLFHCGGLHCSQLAKSSWGVDRIKTTLPSALMFLAIL